MFIDALDLNGSTYLHINIKLVKELGLQAAAYCAEVIDIIKRVLDNRGSTTAKGKIVTDQVGQEYIKVDRVAIKNRIGLDKSQQEAAEKILMDNKLLFRHPSVNNAIMVDGKATLDVILKDTEVFAGVPGLDTAYNKFSEGYHKKVDTSLIAGAIRKAQNYIGKKDLPSDIIQGLKSWVRWIISKEGILIKFEDIDYFIEELLKYEDADMRLKILRTAEVNHLKTVKEAAELIAYNNKVRNDIDNMRVTKLTSTVKTTEQQVATEDDIDGDTEF